MRDIPNEMAARIESGAATLCHVWRLQRADGVVMGFTDHDSYLVVDGVVCRAASGWTAGAGESAVGLAAGSVSAAGVLDDVAITEADVAAGLFDKAKVELWRVDWARPDLKVRLWSGALAKIQRQGESFVAELEGPLAKLERVVGRTYGRMLEAADAWCWDARPYPAFPARGDVWADAGAWRAGHWLNGRLAGDGRDLIEAVLARGGLSPHEIAIEGVEGAAAGYVIDRPMRTRDALEPLLATFDAVAAERDGKVAVLGRVEEVVEIAGEALALPDGGAAETATRTLEPRAGEARVRFINETADYQTGAVVARSDDASATAGGVDLDLPVVCGSGLAKAAAQRALDGESVEAKTWALGPLEALRLEPGDGVRLEGRSDDWRVMRVTSDETPSALLEPVTARRAVEDDGVWRGGETPAVVGAPFLRVMDLPPLMGREDDARPVVVAAAEPWRMMRLHAGASAETLTARADVDTPATVGVLVQALAPGVRHRWDEANALVMRIEGEAPESALEAAVLGGGNALAVETAVGWEIVQYRSAELVGPGTWRLTGLLRGQQGTEVEMRAGAGAGTVVMFLDDRLARAEIGRGERGLPLVCRAGPAGAAPGGAGFSEALFVARGVHDRPWSPSGLTVETSAEGLAIRWTPRVRLFGDSWDGEPTAVDPMRFRLRVFDHDVVVRTMEVEGLSASYSTADLAADFPDGATSTARIAVAQWGEAFGWGSEAEVEAEIRRL